MDYYTSQSTITDPLAHTSLFEGLSSDIRTLCSVIQGIIIHPFEAHRYNVRIPKRRRKELDTRWISLMLARIHELDAHPLTVVRPPGKRLVGNCRDFATMLCAILRYQHIPARVRYGFAAYFEPDFYTDHVICEYWNAEEKRWVIVDAQVDDVQRKAYQIYIDTCDVPDEAFIFAGEAWQMYRAGEAESKQFGIFSGGPGGVSFICSGLIRDLGGLNKQELLCQDVWGLGEVEDDSNVSSDDLILLDRVARITLTPDALHEIQVIYQTERRLQVPSKVKCYAQDGVKMINLITE